MRDTSIKCNCQHQLDVSTKVHIAAQLANLHKTDSLQVTFDFAKGRARKLRQLQPQSAKPAAYAWLVAAWVML